MTLKEAIEKNGIFLKPDGRYLTGKSPFSDSNLPLFIVDEETQTFTDLSTGICGDVYDFIQHIRGVSRETAQSLVDGKEEKAESEEEAVLKEICKDAFDYFKDNLSSAAVTYLREKRGFTDENIEKFGFGYAGNYGNRLYKKLVKKYDKEDILKAGVCKHDKEGKIVDIFFKRLIIPIKDKDGDVVAFGGRVLDDGTPKYINSPETPIFKKREMLFGYHVARNAECNSYIICEGYMDCISLHIAGFTNAVASLGTALTKSQCELLTDKKRVYVLYDSDDAGKNASVKAIPMLRNIGLGTWVIDYSVCKDPDEYLKTYGLESLKEKFAKAENGERYVARILMEQDIDKAVKYLSTMKTDKIIKLLNY